MPLSAQESAAGIIRDEAQRIAERQKEILGASGQPLMGVALSGGGIRSGTFNLGIIQGMAKRGMLKRVDYLSTVSGGGYIGTWLHGLIRRYGQGKPDSVTDLLMRPEGSPHREPESDPIAFLRQYSSYLAPEMGLFSTDFWVIASIWARNVLLNQLILVPFLAAVSLLTFFLGSSAGWYVFAHRSTIGEVSSSLILLLSLVMIAGKGVGSVALNGVHVKSTRRDSDRWDSKAVAITCAVLTLLASQGLALASRVVTDAGWVGGALPFVTGLLDRRSYWLAGATIIGIIVSLLFLVLQWQGQYFVCFRGRHGGRWPWFGSWGYPLLAGVPTGFLLFGVMKVIAVLDARPEGSWNTVAWGPPFLSFAILAGASLHIGLMGVDFEDNAREWLARLGACVCLFALAWAALFTISVFGPYWIARLAVLSWAPIAGLSGGWIVTSVGGALYGTSSRTPAKPGEKPPSGILHVIGTIAPTVFIAGYLLLISFGLHLALVRLCGVPEKKPDAAAQTSASANRPPAIQVSAQATGANGLQVTVNNTSREPPGFVISTAANESALLEIADYKIEMPVALELLLAAVVMVWYLPRRIDINEFSMHHFYKNRLVRCYLGATRGSARRPSRFTGFDPGDDIPIEELVPGSGYFGPFPIVNACINLNRGSELAKRERKGSAFIFTPLYSGYDPPRSDADREAQARTELWRSGRLHADGYRPTKGFGYPRGYEIGTCMAISGAAANPNDGSHTSGPLAFLMTIFNVRLGWWVGNTRRDAPSSRPGPRHSLMALLAELFALTDASSNFVNLSDGGHFENLALYELVRRRCRYIIAGDGEQDTGYNFDSLGGAIRKCRTDFGTEISIDPRRIRLKGGLSRTHCVVGTITYPLQEGETERQTGWLLYLKSSLTGDEPEDVAQYKSSHQDFPQETTANQFFTESQFESYRKLGLHIFESAFENVDPAAPADDPEAMFASLYRNWYPPPELSEGVASQHADTYSKLIGMLSDPVLSRLRDQLIAPRGNPDHVAEIPVFDNDADRNKVFAYTLSLIQLMENVWSDLHMSEKINRDSPANSGWMAVFRYWVRQPMFRDAWKQAGYTYNRFFQQFYNALEADKE
jgi:hypothetical protein